MCNKSKSGTSVYKFFVYMEETVIKKLDNGKTKSSNTIIRVSKTVTKRKKEGSK